MLLYNESPEDGRKGNNCIQLNKKLRSSEKWTKYGGSNGECWKRQGDSEWLLMSMDVKQDVEAGTFITWVLHKSGSS